MSTCRRYGKSHCLSCDTMVALGSATKDGHVLFAKNSDRPDDEIQNVVSFPASDWKPGTKVKCTYIEIAQAAHTYQVVLCQPFWMWGAEMAFNECNVVIGNEAVWTKEPLSDKKALLGMDLVRLGAERGSTAEEALHVIIALLEEHGQGGSCSHDSEWSYHNSFLIADPTCAWVLETAGNSVWVAEMITDGVRNISNDLSIRENFDISSKDLKLYAKSKGYWDGKSDFDFANCFTPGGCSGPVKGSREGRVKTLLDTASGGVTVPNLISILRDHDGGICMHGGFESTCALVSSLSPTSMSVHYVTGTSSPCQSIFKPLIISKDLEIPNICSATQTSDPTKLWWAHEQHLSRVDSSIIQPQLLSLENMWLDSVVEFLKSSCDGHEDEEKEPVRDCDTDAVRGSTKLIQFADLVSAEMELYNARPAGGDTNT